MVLERLHRLERFGIKLGLENIRALCEELGHPERAFASLHIGGTNGKGSVTAMAHAALRAAGIAAARYTSPHLVRLNERFVIGDAAVPDADLVSAAADVLDLADALQARGVLGAPPTFFEATTAIAFELFRRAGVEVAVLEVGLGGRFDATNVVTPIVSAITSIGLDHQQHLGTTLPQIAFEKAGIIKPGVPVVVGELPAEAIAVVREAAALRGAPLVLARDGVSVTASRDSEFARVAIATPTYRYGPATLGLRGDHQIGNALVALRVLEQSRAAGVPVSFEAIEYGLTHVEWPARLETLVFDRGRALIIDAAHNVDGAAVLSAYLARRHPERLPLVFGAMRDKDVAAVLHRLLPAVGVVVVTAPPMARARAPEDLAAIVRAIDPRRLVVIECEPERAVERAWEHGATACVAGSIFLAGAVRGALLGRAIVDSSR